MLTGLVDISSNVVEEGPVKAPVLLCEWLMTMSKIVANFLNGLLSLKLENGP